MLLRARRLPPAGNSETFKLVPHASFTVLAARPPTARFLARTTQRRVLSRRAPPRIQFSARPSLAAYLRLQDTFPPCGACPHSKLWRDCAASVHPSSLRCVPRPLCTHINGKAPRSPGRPCISPQSERTKPSAQQKQTCTLGGVRAAPIGLQNQARTHAQGGGCAVTCLRSSSSFPILATRALPSVSSSTLCCNPREQLSVTFSASEPLPYSTPF